MSSFTRFERSNATREPSWVRFSLITISLLFFGVFLLLPLTAVFYEALHKGWEVYLKAINNADAFAAIKLTVIAALISVPLNLIFGIAIGDRDGVGKDGQNKGIADGTNDDQPAHHNQ